MAVIETWLAQDLKEPVQVKQLCGNFFSHNGNGNRIGVNVFDNGSPATLSGTVSGYAVLKDGTTVPCTGSLSGNQASVLLPAAAYVPGNIFVTIMLTSGTTITTLAALTGTVVMARTDTQVDPGSVVTDWTNTINAALQTVEGYTGNIIATPYASLTYPVPLGKYCIYNNLLYRCVSPIASSESWTASHWTQVKLADDVSDLKSAMNTIGNIQGDNLIDLSNFTEYVGSENMSWSVANNEITVSTPNRTVPYGGVKTKSIFIPSIMEEGKKYRFHAKAVKISGSPDISIYILGTSTSETAAAKSFNLKDGGVGYVDFVADTYMKSVYLAVTGATAAIASAKFSEVWIKKFEDIDENARDEIDTLKNDAVEYNPDCKDVKTSDFTNPSHTGVTFSYNAETDTVTVTNASTTTQYAALQTQSGFFQNHLVAGKKYRFHVKCKRISGIANIQFSVKGVSGNEGTIYVRKRLYNEDEAYIDFTATEYNKYFALYVTFGTPSTSVVEFSDVWVREISSITANDKTARERIDNISEELSDLITAESMTNKTHDEITYSYDSSTGKITITNSSQVAQYAGMQTPNSMIQTKLVAGKKYRFHASVKYLSGNPTPRIAIRGINGSDVGVYKSEKLFDGKTVDLDFVATEYNTYATLFITFGSTCYGASVEFSDVWIREEEGYTATDYTARKLASNSNAEDAEIIKKLRNARHIRSNHTYNPLTLLHFSDIHGDTGAMERITAKRETYGNLVDDMICTGDVVPVRSEEWSTSWWDENAMICIGNHDSAVQSGANNNWTGLSMADRVSYYISPFETHWGIERESGKSYYYKDYSGSNVRMIVLDSMLFYDNNTIDMTSAEATDQMNWLENLLDSADGKHILIAAHTMYAPAYVKACTFSQVRAASNPFYCSFGLPDDVYNLVKSKITNDSLNFIGYICGHTHIDWILESSEHTQLSFDITCATTDPRNPEGWGGSDCYHGETADAFNLLTIDTNNSQIKIIRGGGCNSTNQMTVRKMICFNYATGEIIGEEK